MNLLSSVFYNLLKTEWEVGNPDWGNPTYLDWELNEEFSFQLTSEGLSERGVVQSHTKTHSGRHRRRLPLHFCKQVYLSPGYTPRPTGTISWPIHLYPVVFIIENIGGLSQTENRKRSRVGTAVKKPNRTGWNWRPGRSEQSRSDNWEWHDTSSFSYSLVHSNSPKSFAPSSSS